MLKRSATVSVTIMPRCPPRLTAVDLALPLDRTRPSLREINTLSAPNSPEDLLKERRRSLFLVTLAMDPSVDRLDPPMEAPDGYRSTGPDGLL